MKINNTDNYEFINITINKDSHPIAFKERIDSLIESNFTKEDALKIASEPIEMEIYYDKNSSLIMVDSNASESGAIFNPYDGKRFEDDLIPTTKNNWLEMTILEIIDEFSEDGEPLDGDGVDDLTSIIKSKINLHQGNITDKEYNTELDNHNKKNTFIYCDDTLVLGYRDEVVKNLKYAIKNSDFEDDADYIFDMMELIETIEKEHSEDEIIGLDFNPMDIIPILMSFGDRSAKLMELVQDGKITLK